MNKKYYYGCCVSFPDPVEVLSAMIESGVSITRKTFLRHVDASSRMELEKGLGYAMGGSKDLHCASDWAVSYYKGKLHGRDVVWMYHSSIEYVFVPESLMV